MKFIYLLVACGHGMLDELVDKLAPLKAKAGSRYGDDRRADL